MKRKPLHNHSQKWKVSISIGRPIEIISIIHTTPTPAL